VIVNPPIFGAPYLAQVYFFSDVIFSFQFVPIIPSLPQSACVVEQKKNTKNE